VECSTYKTVAGKLESKKPLWISKWQDYIKMDLERIGKGYEGVDWIYLAQERAFWLVLVTTLLKPPAPRKELENQDRSGSIVEDRGITIRFPGRAKFSLLAAESRPVWGPTQ
jgi:hypothetical protein